MRAITDREEDGYHDSDDMEHHRSSCRSDSIPHETRDRFLA